MAEKNNRLAFALAAVSCALFTFFLVMEISLRVSQRIKYGIPFFASIRYDASDPELGWIGRQVWGDVKSQKLKIFFVGDSFTAAFAGLKDKDMYFSVVKKNIDVEIFVYGGGGYGTLQEYMVIDRYIDAVNPDVVLLQLCSNDFINNLWRLEKDSLIHNNYAVRPYYENGMIRYHFPRGSIFFNEYLFPYSRCLYFINFKVDRVLATLAQKGYLRSSESLIPAKGLDLPAFRESAGVTRYLLQKIKQRCVGTPLIAFSVFDDEPYFSQFRGICKDNGIRFIEEIPRVAWVAEGKGKVINNSHWGVKGHAACGKYLARYLKANLPAILQDREGAEKKEEKYDFDTQKKYQRKG